MCRNSQGTLGTDKKFTGQRLDGTGLYYYGARYYDASTGRFISPDATGQDLNNPQTLNRYTYCLNNPLNRNDPTGHWPNWLSMPTWNGWKEFGNGLVDSVVNIGSTIQQIVSNPGQTVQAMGYAVSHPVQTAQSIYSDYANLMRTPYGQGEICGQIATTVLTIGAASYFSEGGEGLQAVSRIAAVDDVGSSAALPKGVMSVYQSIDETTGQVNYVGITNDIERRAAEQFLDKGIDIQPINGLSNLSMADARSVEQFLIDNYGLGKNGGTLLNKINSIATTNPIYNDAIQRGNELLRSVGYFGY